MSFNFTPNPTPMNQTPNPGYDIHGSSQFANWPPAQQQQLLRTFQARAQQRPQDESQFLDTTYLQQQQPPQQQPRMQTLPLQQQQVQQQPFFAQAFAQQPQTLQQQIATLPLQQPQATTIGGQLNITQIPAAQVQGQIQQEEQAMPSKFFTVTQIKQVQELIEGCLKRYMSQHETIMHLCQTYTDIEPGFISLSMLSSHFFTLLVWQKLVQQNPEFFQAYHLRLQLKEQILLFNDLVNVQAILMQQQGVIVQNNTQVYSPHPLSHPPPTSVTTTTTSTSSLPLSQPQPIMSQAQTLPLQTQPTFVSFSQAPTQQVTTGFYHNSAMSMQPQPTQQPQQQQQQQQQQVSMQPQQQAADVNVNTTSSPKPWQQGKKKEEPVSFEMFSTALMQPNQSNAQLQQFLQRAGVKELPKMAQQHQPQQQQQQQQLQQQLPIQVAAPVHHQYQQQVNAAHQQQQQQQLHNQMQNAMHNTMIPQQLVDDTSDWQSSEVAIERSLLESEELGSTELTDI
jgi:uncharacterized protein (TIGR01589 family)